MAGSEIRTFRRSLKLNQRDFAKKIGVAQNTVARWETDKVKPSPLAIARIREVEKSGVGEMSSYDWIFDALNDLLGTGASITINGFPVVLLATVLARGMMREGKVGKGREGNPTGGQVRSYATQLRTSPLFHVAMHRGQWYIGLKGPSVEIERRLP